MYTWVNKALVVRAGVVSRRVGVYCMYWTTARHKPLSLALPICTLTDGPEWLIDALTCRSKSRKTYLASSINSHFSLFKI